MKLNRALSITKPILCIGAICVDIVEQCNSMPAGKSNHISVAAHWLRGGHASNVSYVLRLLGAQVEFLGVLSRSSLLREILLEMEHINIDLSNCPRTDKTPAFTTVVIDRQTGCRSILQCSRKFPYIGIEEFKKLDLDRYGWVHFEARNKLDIIPMMRAIHNYNSRRTERIKISLKIYPVTIDSDDKMSDHYSEDDESEYFICKKYMNRQFNPSDGKLSTKLMNAFQIVESEKEDSEEDSEAQFEHEDRPWPTHHRKSSRMSKRKMSAARKSISLRPFKRK